MGTSSAAVRWSVVVMTHPWLVFLSVSALLLVLGLPFLHLQVGSGDVNALPPEAVSRRGDEVLREHFPGADSNRILVVVRYPDGNVWHYVNVCFECVVRGGTLTTCDETLALEYVPPRRLPAALLSSHKIRIRDACARRIAPFVR